MNIFCKVGLTTFLLFNSLLMLGAVNINNANQEELESLKGIGPVRAKAIITYRTQNGPFGSIDDLNNVEGIGPGTIKKIRQDVILEGKTTIKKEETAGYSQSSTSNRASSMSSTPRTTTPAKSTTISAKTVASGTKTPPAATSPLSKSNYPAKPVNKPATTVNQANPKHIGQPPSPIKKDLPTTSKTQAKKPPTTSKKSLTIKNS